MTPTATSPRRPPAGSPGRRATPTPTTTPTGSRRGTTDRPRSRTPMTPLATGPRPAQTPSATTVTGGATVTTTSDAFDQPITQGSATYAYDALGRVANPGFAYTGTSNALATDGTATYLRGPAGDLFGVKQGGTSVYAWTDQHSDVVGQLTATGSVLAGSTTYDPFGKVVARVGQLGNLGYQSGWTDNGTGRVNMAARWYNPATGQFDSRDSVDVSPVPNPAAANPFGYAAGNPLGNVDPDGHLPLCLRGNGEDLSTGCRNPAASAILPVGYETPAHTRCGQFWHGTRPAGRWVWPASGARSRTGTGVHAAHARPDLRYHAWGRSVRPPLGPGAGRYRPPATGR